VIFAMTIPPFDEAQNPGLLTTKLHVPPPRPNLVPRPHLIERLDRGLHGGRKLTLVSAPAGFGKTTLVAAWLHRGDEMSASPRAAWLSLDAGDNDPARFFTYLIAALQMIKADIGRGLLDSSTAPHMPPLEPLLTALINEMASLSGRMILVLDDYHLIENPSIHRALNFLLDHLPHPMHLVIATRSDPPLHLARLRGRAQLTELRLTDLRFSFEEAARFLNQAMGLALSDEGVAALASRTEGWITGLQMAAVSMGRQDAGHVDHFIRAFTGSDRYVLDYLVEEVLSQRPQGTQDFLMQTALLSRLCGPLCDAVCGTDPGSGQRTLEQLEQSNLFILPLDNERRWYRYHRLFADLLQQRLQRSKSDLVPTLHRRASVWYAQNGLMGEAIDHALCAQNFERAADLIKETAQATWMRGEVATFLRWVEALPEQVMRTRPLLCVFHAIALFLTGRSVHAIEARLQDAVQGEAGVPIPGEVAAIRGMIATFQGEARHSIDLSRRALELLPQESLFLRSLAAWNLGMSHFVNGDIETGMRAFEEAARIGQEAGNLLVAVVALCPLAEFSMFDGQLDKAQAMYEQALKLATDEWGKLLPIAGMALIGLGELRRERNDLEAAARYLEQGIELSLKWGEISAFDGYIALARVQFAQGEFRRAQETMAKAQQLAVRFDSSEFDDILVGVHQARLCIALGDLEAATRWARERGLLQRPPFEPARGEAGGLYFYILREFEHLALARLHIAQGRPDVALEVLAPLLAPAENLKRRGSVIEISILRALALQAQGQVSSALVALERALTLAQPENYVRIFVDEGEPLAQLLYQAARRNLAPGYTGRLLAAFPASKSAPPRQESPAALVEPLSERELEVLALIAEGLSNQEIAQRLFISLRTVKWHASNIYGKLGVSNRTQAVTRARALGVLLAD
jgi:LuxR family maltose regulon positive regulatory protein